jgi:hypothetical protein
MAAPTLRETRTKRDDETVSITFDFAPMLVPTTTLTGTPTIVAETGLAVLGGGSVSDATVTVQVRGGTTGDDYALACVMSASNGDVHGLEVVILIRDEN